MFALYYLHLIFFKAKKTTVTPGQQKKLKVFLMRYEAVQ